MTTTKTDTTPLACVDRRRADALVSFLNATLRSHDDDRSFIVAPTEQDNLWHVLLLLEPSNEASTHIKLQAVLTTRAFLWGMKAAQETER